MMGQSKTKIKETEENGVLSKRRSTDEVDHWAFLEEIEAPMWADLTLEPNLIAEDSDDAWFQTSHLFHQHSARRLRSAFAHPDAGDDFSSFNLRGVCSPKLPSSVSKSRGKDYKSRDWRNNAGISINKGHPVNELGVSISRLDTDSSPDCEAEARSGANCEVSGQVTSSTCTDSGAKKVSDNSLVAADDAETSGALNSWSVSSSGVSTSTITTVSQQEDPKSLEVPKQEFGPNGGLLNALKTNLRKSCATTVSDSLVEANDADASGALNSRSVSTSGASTSTTTTVNQQQYSKTVEVSRQEFGHTGGLLNALKTNLRKSCASRPASRVEILDDSEPKGRKYSSGKSSVGSSSIGCDTKGKGSLVVPKNAQTEQVRRQVNRSIESKVRKPLSRKLDMHSSNPRLEVNNMAPGLKQKTDVIHKVRKVGERGQSAQGRLTARKMGEALIKKWTPGLKQNEDGYPHGRGLGKLADPVKGRVKPKQVGEASVCVKNAYTSMIKGRDGDAVSTRLQAAKPKALLQNSSNQPRGGAPGVKGKVGSNRCNGSSCSGKENVRVKAVSGQISGGKNNMAVVRVSDRTVPKLKSENKVGTITSVGSKVNIGKTDDSKRSLDARVHLR